MRTEESLVAIRQPQGKNVGSGVLVDIDAGLVLTCAHVVNVALGIPDAKEPPKGEISLTLFGARDKPLTAKVDNRADAWSPLNGGRDLCLLKIQSKVTNTQAKSALLADFDASGDSFRAFGFPKNWKGEFDTAKGQVVSFDDTSSLYLLRPEEGTQTAALSIESGVLADQKPVAGEISEGFSGGPVEVRGQIVGLVSQTRPPKEATAYMTPSQFFPASLRNRIRSFAKDIDREFPHVLALRKEIEKRQERMVAGLTPFDIRGRLIDNFADALQTQTVPSITDLPSEEALRDYEQDRDLRPPELARFLEIGKDPTCEPLSSILLHAPGGSGKSYFLLELIRVASDYNLVPFLLDFSRSAQEEAGPIDNAQGQFDSWFSSGRGWGPVNKLFQLGSDATNAKKPLLVVDGLNQAPLNWGSVIARIERIARGELAGAVIIIADRMVDRNPESSLRRAVITPLASAVYGAVLPEKLRKSVGTDSGWQQILSSPLFLNKFLNMPGVADASSGGAVPSRFSILDQYFREGGCQFDRNEMVLLSDFAYEAYRLSNGTAFGAEQFKKLLEGNSSLAAKIRSSDLIQDLGNGDHQFQHQILHDQLAALKVASATKEGEERFWRAPAFDVLSLHSASSDSIELAVEALQTPNRLLADPPRKDLSPWKFLTEVYDWNYRISFQCVASLDRRGDPALRPWMRHSIYALNLERAFDPFLYTAMRTGQLRQEIPLSRDITYLDAESTEILREKVKQAISGETPTDIEEKKQFENWRELYFRNQSFRPCDLSPLWGDPLLSWTAANVIRRLVPDESVTKELIRLYEISKATSDSAERAKGFRWRIVHALGRSKPIAQDFLVDVVFNSLEGHHVRYGAIRSLIELVVMNAQQADQKKIFEILRSRVGELFPDKPTPEADGVRELFRRCCAFNEPYADGSPGWLQNWLATGLEQFRSILLEGEKVASGRGLLKEAAQWHLWATAVERATQAPDWVARFGLWKETIGKD